MVDTSTVHGGKIVEKKVSIAAVAELIGYSAKRSPTRTQHSMYDTNTCTIVVYIVLLL